MSCECSKAKSLPKCIDSLIIGDVVDGSKSYNVILKRPDGRVDIYPSVDIVYTDLIGVEDIEVVTGTIYTVWLNDTTSNDINAKTAFTPIGATSSVTCVEISFDYCDDTLFTQQITLV